MGLLRWVLALFSTLVAAMAYGATSLLLALPSRLRTSFAIWNHNRRVMYADRNNLSCYSSGVGKGQGDSMVMVMGCSMLRSHSLFPRSDMGLNRFFWAHTNDWAQCFYTDRCDERNTMRRISRRISLNSGWRAEASFVECALISWCCGEDTSLLEPLSRHSSVTLAGSSAGWRLSVREDNRHVQEVIVADEHEHVHGAASALADQRVLSPVLLLRSPDGLRCVIVDCYHHHSNVNNQLEEVRDKCLQYRHYTYARPDGARQAVDPHDIYIFAAHQFAFYRLPLHAQELQEAPFIELQSLNDVEAPWRVWTLSSATLLHTYQREVALFRHQRQHWSECLARNKIIEAPWPMLDNEPCLSSRGDRDRALPAQA